MTLQTRSGDQLYSCEAATEVVLNHVLICSPHRDRIMHWRLKTLYDIMLSKLAVNQD